MMIYDAILTNITNIKKTCFPEVGIKNNQSARIVVKFLKNNPNMLHERRSLLAVQALNEAFQCK